MFLGFKEIFISLRTSEIHLFYNLQLFYWHFLEVLWLFIFLVLYLSLISNVIFVPYQILFVKEATFLFQIFQDYKNLSSFTKRELLCYLFPTTQKSKLITLLFFIFFIFTQSHQSGGKINKQKTDSYSYSTRDHFISHFPYLRIRYITFCPYSYIPLRIENVKDYCLIDTFFYINYTLEDVMSPFLAINTCKQEMQSLYVCILQKAVFLKRLYS